MPRQAKPPPRTGKPLKPQALAKLTRLTTPHPPRRSSQRSGTQTDPFGQTGSAGALNRAVAEALGLVPARRPFRRPPSPEPEPVPITGELMEPTLGSVLQFSPVKPGWTAVLSDEDGKRMWQEPIIGWATVVIWTAYGEDNTDEKLKDTKQFQTEVQPFTLTEDGTAEVPLFREGVELQSLVMPGQVVTTGRNEDE